MSDELVCNFGILPAGAVIWNGGPTRATIETKVRFALQLWRVGAVYQLRHHQQTLDLPLQGAVNQSLKFHWMRPAKGPGFCDLRIGNGTIEFPQLLLEARYDDLDWMRATAGQLAKLLEIRLVEGDMGSDC